MTGETKLTIEITTGHCLGGESNDVYPGDILEAPKDLSIADAMKKVRLGYARIIPNTPEPVVESHDTSGPTTITHQDPAIESRDPVTESPEGARKGRSRGSHPSRAGGR